MKKKLIGATLLAAALTMSTGVTAFAGWVTDENGTMYQKADGTYQGWGWFTDPDTGLEYYFDLGGYIMKDTHVDDNGTFWLDENGVKQEKTEEQIAAEEAKAARDKTAHTPGNTARKAKEEAKASADGTLATSTRRAVYQQEMNIFTNRAFVGIRKALNADGLTDYSGDVAEDNQQSTYYYDTAGKVRVLYATLWKNSTTTSKSYVPYAYELNYNRNVIHGDESEYFNDGFKAMVIAALGENEGNAVYEKIMAQEVGSDAQLKENGTTDTGNSYELVYRYNNANIKVTCSEIVPETEETTEETAEAASETAEAASETAEAASETAEAASETAETASEAAETASETAETAAEETAAAEETSAEDETGAAENEEASEETAEAAESAE